MIQLLKYEFRKTSLMKYVMLGITAVAEIVFLIGVYSLKDNLIAIGMLILMMAALFGGMLIGLQSILTLHRDMNSKQGYMLFMTPHSSCSILGAKVLECSVSVALTGLFYLLLGYVDIQLLLGKAFNIRMITQYLTNVLQQAQLNIPINFGGFAALVFYMVAAWIALVTTVYLADVIASALLNGRRFNGLIAFVIFIGLNILQGYASGIIPANLPIIQNLLLTGGVSLLFAVIMYVITFNLMDRYLSV